MNITERFFRAVGAEIKPAEGWPGNSCWVLNGQIISKRKVSLDWFFPDDDPFKEDPSEHLPNITQSYPDFKKYVIPVMHEKSYDLEIFFNQDGYTYATLTPTKKGLQIKEVEKHSLEGLESAVEAAVEVLEGGE